MNNRFLNILLPEWKSKQLLDRNHPHARRKSVEYKKKQGLVKNIWIGAGVAMLCAPTPAFVVSLSLATTFIAFTILDETD
ncbi:hypothetical protein NBRC116493_35010 [Aurantivibrio infirmus]